MEIYISFSFFYLFLFYNFIKGNIFCLIGLQWNRKTDNIYENKERDARITDNNLPKNQCSRTTIENNCK